MLGETYSFKITETTIEKRIDGNTFIKALCLDTMITVEITIKNIDSNNRNLIKNNLLKEHKKQLEIKGIDNCISIGEVL